MKASKMKAPRPQISVTAKHYEQGIKQSSSHCAIELAFQEQAPWARNILVDTQTIRASDPENGLRYIWYTPNIVTSAIIAWDYGVVPAPFSFRLRGAQIISMRTRSGRDRKNQLVHKLGRRKMTRTPGDSKKRMRATIIGGRAPPTNPLGARRIFGRKGLGIAGIKHPFELLLEAHAPK